jgi:geranylgeranyl diphosphate synthase type II
MDYNSQYLNYLNKFDTELNKALGFLKDIPPLLKESMTYAIIDGGKRIRPVLCFATADMLGVDLEKVNEFAVAIECIHSYSLVHDDLPAMDNDDFRRGKFSTHKKFGEAYGILAGDALLNFAFEYPLNQTNFNTCDAVAMKILAECAGSKGMIAGQVLDLQNEKNSDVSERILYDIYLNKTAKLLIAPLLIASVFANKKYFSELKDFGYHLGVMFQISDDIMDVEGSVESIGKTPNKDAQVDKLTSIKVFGIDGAKERLNYHYLECLKILDKINANSFLEEFTKKMYVRKK